MHNFRGYITQKAGISSQIFEEFVSSISVMQVKRGAYLLRKGEHCNHAIFVEKGLLRLYSISEEGKENILQFAPETWIVSDRSAVQFNEPSEYYIDAIEDSEVILLSEELMCGMVEKSHAFGRFNEKALHNHVRYLNRRIDMLIGASAKTRYLDFIKLYPDIMLRAPQWMIASYLGITPESLSRVRKALADEHYK